MWRIGPIDDERNDLVLALNVEIEPERNFISALVRNTPDLNANFIYGSALHIAAERNFLISARILLEAGASVNIGGSMSETPLHICSAFKHGTDMLLLLLEYGADVNATDHAKRTPLHEAASSKCVENVKELLKHGAEVDAVARSGDTPLHCASFDEPDIAILRILLSAGADANRTNRHGLAPLHFAAVENLLEIIHLLLTHNANANVRNNEGNTPLHRVARLNFQPVDTIRALIRGGAKLNALDRRGQSALFSAIIAHNVEAVRELLRSGAPFELADCLEYQRGKYLFPDEMLAISQELIRYWFIKRPFSLEIALEQLMQDHILDRLSKLFNGKSTLDIFKEGCLTEVEELSKKSCDCGNSSVWGSMVGCRACICDTHRAILKFLFSGRSSHFSDAFFYKVRKEFLIEIAFNLMSYFEFKESKNRVMLNRDCMKEIESYVSFDSVVSFLQSKRSLIGVGEFDKFLAFTDGEASDKSSNVISAPNLKILGV